MWTKETLSQRNFYLGVVGVWVERVFGEQVQPNVLSDDSNISNSSNTLTDVCL